MQPATKKSKQRDAIIKFLMTRKDHPTADMVYMNIKEKFPKISLGTVYRNLALLSERGEILKLSYEGGARNLQKLFKKSLTKVKCDGNIKTS